MGKRGLVAVAALFVGCSGGREPSVLEGRGAAVVEGYLDSGHPAVMHLHHDLDFPGTGSYCTGTLITPTTVLTAGHCLPASDGTVVYACLGSDGTNTSQCYSGLSLRNPSCTPANNCNSMEAEDVGLIQLSSAVSGVTPASLWSDVTMVNDPVTIVGFGASSTDPTAPSDSQKRYGYNSVALIRDANYYQIFGLPSIGPGDSGGPSFFGGYSSSCVEGVHSYASNPAGANTISGDLRIDDNWSWIAASVTNGPAGQCQACGDGVCKTYRGETCSSCLADCWVSKCKRTGQKFCSLQDCQASGCALCLY